MLGVFLAKDEVQICKVSQTKGRVQEVFVVREVCVWRNDHVNKD